MMIYKCHKKHMQLHFILALLMFFNHLIAEDKDNIFYSKLHSEIPEWMKSQVESNLAFFQNKSISRQKIHEFYESKSMDQYLIKFSITKNNLRIEKKCASEGIDYRLNSYIDALHALCKISRLPDMVFLLSMHDAYTSDSHDIPVFAMCKNKEHQNIVLLPDFDALKARYQVLKDKDITKYSPAWDQKINQLIWRGSTAQVYPLTEESFPLFTRRTLCFLSQIYPEIIDAKFTFYAQGGENFHALQYFKGSWLSFEDQLLYKYHIFIDGNVSPYSNSGWKFFTNSIIFKPDSQWEQWYFNALKPYVHYIPVGTDLEDLVELIQWTKDHDSEARFIASNAREFAVNNLTIENNFLYLYYTLTRYSNLDFVD